MMIVENTYFLHCDVTNAAKVQQLIDSIVAKFKRIDVVVNNAGITAKGVFEEEPLKSIELIVNVNYTAVVLISNLALKQMLKQKEGGCIINISSMSGVIPFTLDPVYTGTKFAVVGFTRSMTRYWKRQKVKVNAVCPFFFRTKLITESKTKEFHEVVKKLPFVEVDQVVSAVKQVSDPRS